MNNKAQQVFSFFNFIKEGIKKYQDTFNVNKDAYIKNFELSTNRTFTDYINITNKNLSDIYIAKLENTSATIQKDYQ
jgi:hypothetical protein